MSCHVEPGDEKSEDGKPYLLLEINPTVFICASISFVITYTQRVGGDYHSEERVIRRILCSMKPLDLGVLALSCVLLLYIYTHIYFERYIEIFGPCTFSARSNTLSLKPIVCLFWAFVQWTIPLYLYTVFIIFWTYPKRFKYWCM